MNRGQGFTLVEMLVAMAITSLLVMLLMGFLYYVFRIETTVRLEADQREPQLRSSAWLRDAISGCIPVAIEDRSGSSFAGKPYEMRCESTSPLSAQAPRTSARVTLTIKTNDVGSGAALEYRDDVSVDPVELWRTEQPGLSFSYVAADGKQVDNWPLEGRLEERLPRQVWLMTKNGDSRQVIAIYSPSADPWLAPDMSRVIGFGVR